MSKGCLTSGSRTWPDHVHELGAGLISALARVADTERELASVQALAEDGSTSGLPSLRVEAAGHCVLEPARSA